jgi:hypothetical protein
MTIGQGRRQQKTPTGRSRLRRIGCGILTVIGTTLCLSAASNLFFRARSDQVERLTNLDKARIEEAFRLRRTVGNSVWPGWANATIPLIVYNETYAFLIGLDSPGSGWCTVPQNLVLGGPWKTVPDDSIDGWQYFRQRLPDRRTSPQAFTVRVGESWAGSMSTKDWTLMGMGNEIRDSLPPVIRVFAPYRLMARVFLGLAMNTDGYICGLEHESFHAYQGMMSAGRLASAETALSRLRGRYPWTDSPFNAAWKAELNALADALSVTEEERTVELASRFTALRRDRRKAFHLDSALVDLERLREWEEGLGKYAELAVWKCAASANAYKPVQALSADPDFNGFRDFGGKWAQELTTLRLQSRAGEIRFYYSGMAQAFLLDRLNPEWKTSFLCGDAFLEDRLSRIVANLKERPTLPTRPGNALAN